jgi:hypothetical protein
MLCSFNVASSGPYCSCGCTADFTELLRPRYRRPLAIGMSLMLFQQITGQPSVLYYAAKIFQAAGFAEAGEATGVALVLGFFKLVMTGVREGGSGDGEKEGGLVICCCCCTIAAVPALAAAATTTAVVVMLGLLVWLLRILPLKLRILLRSCAATPRLQ